MESWYDCIEPEVREIVRELRNRGINTTASCGHQMWIQCDSSDPTHEMFVIKTILIENQIESFEIELICEFKPKLMLNRSTITIRLNKEE